MLTLNKMLSRALRTAPNAMKQLEICHSDDMQAHIHKKVCFQGHINFTSESEKYISASVTCVSVKCRDHKVQIKCITYSSLMTATLPLLTVEINEYPTTS